MIACIPFQYGANLLCCQKFMLFADGIAYLCHDRVLGFLLLIAKTEIDGPCKRFVF